MGKREGGEKERGWSEGVRKRERGEKERERGEKREKGEKRGEKESCLLYTSPSPRDFG